MKDIAGVALDREVLVQGADERFVGVQDDTVVGDFGNCAARGNREHARSPAAPHRTVHFVAVDHRAAAPASAGNAFGRHRHDRIEIGPREGPVRPGTPGQLEERVLGVLDAGRFRDELL